MSDQQTDPHLDALAEVMSKLDPAVVQHILGTLNAPTPVAPTPPAFTGLSPLKAAAAAMNPQFAPTLINQQMAPEQARFQQQQAAFEQAMQGKREALTAGSSIYNAGQRALTPRAGTIPKGQIRVIEGPDGKPALQEFVPDGQGGFNPGKVLATGPDTARFLATPEGYLQVSGKTGESSGYVKTPSGANALPPPPPGTVSDVAASTATLQGLDALRGAYGDIRQKIQGQSLPGQIVRSAVGGTSLGGAFKETRDYAEYTAKRRAALNAYIKSVTGAQFSVAELQRYEAQFPEPWDDEALAEEKIKALSQRAVADMKAKIAAYPAAGKAAPKYLATPDPAVDTFREIFGREPGQ